MGKSMSFFFVLVVCAGAAGAVVSHLVARSDGAVSGGAEAPPPREAIDGYLPTRAEWEAVQVELGSLRTRVGELTAKLEETGNRLTEVESAASALPPRDGEAANLLRTAQGDATSGYVSRTVPVPASGSIVMPGGLVPFGGFGKSAELMALPEEERWAKIREDLSLDAWQEDELKQLGKEMRDASRVMFSPEAIEEGNLAATVAKVMDLRTKTNERVKNLLSDEQYKKFKSGGYGAAMGLGSTSVAVSYSSTSMPRETGGK